MNRALLVAAAAVMSAMAVTAYAGAGGGGGGGGDRVYDPNSAPPGFYTGVPAFDNQRSAEAYVIRQQQAELAARATAQPSLAQNQVPNAG